MPDSSGAEWLEIFSPPVNNKWTIHLKQQRPSLLPSSKLKQIGSNLTCSDQEILLQMKRNILRLNMTVDLCLHSIGIQANLKSHDLAFTVDSKKIHKTLFLPLQKKIFFENIV